MKILSKGGKPLAFSGMVISTPPRKIAGENC